MAKKIVLGGLAGSVAVFLMSMIFHMVTQLGEMGVKAFPNEDAVMSMMRLSITESGMYIFPGADMSDKSAAAQAAYAAKYKQGPTGILVLTMGGKDLQFGRLLLNQYLMNLIAALLIAWILAITARATTYGSRVVIVFLAALAGGVIYSMPYWNWYGFPAAYTAGDVGSWVVSWTVGGFVMAAIVKEKMT